MSEGLAGAVPANGNPPFAHCCERQADYGPVALGEPEHVGVSAEHAPGHVLRLGTGKPGLCHQVFDQVVGDGRAAVDGPRGRAQFFSRIPSTASDMARSTASRIGR